MPESSFNINEFYVEFLQDGGTPEDLQNLHVQVKNRRFFSLTTPDPEFSGFTVDPKDQLPGRPLEGKIEIATFFQHLQLFVTEAQQKGPVNGSTIYNHLKANNLPVLGPNVGQFLFEHQDLIPVELRGKVALVFWGKVYRFSDDRRYVRSLGWGGRQWVWRCGWVGGGGWFADGQAVMLAR